jgi:hypothetical protein
MSAEAGRPDAVEVVREELARRGVASDPGPVRAMGQVAGIKSATPAPKVPDRKAPAPRPPRTGGDVEGRLVDVLLDLLDAVADGLSDH